MTIIIPTVLAALGLQSLSLTPVASFIDQKLFHPIVFRIRERIRPLPLDPRIKIFQFDNRTAAYLKAHDMPLNSWGQVIAAIGQKPNTKILINKLFDSPYTAEEVQSFKEQTKASLAQTVIMVFTFGSEISYRKPITDALIKDNEAKTFVSRSESVIFQDLALRNTPYGANAEVLSAFSAFGHNEYKGDHRQAPVLVLAGKGLLPHAALAGVDSLEFDNHKIKAEGSSVSLGKDGKILVNFIPKETFHKASYSLLAVVERARRSQDISIVKPGDYVLLLPAMYTGSTDYHETPFGPMPGGVLMVSMLNSALRGSWLTEMHDYGISVLLMAFFGFTIGAALKPSKALATLALASVLLACASISLFVAGGFVYSFVLPTVSLLICGLTGIVLHATMASIEEVRMTKELEVATLVQQSFFPKQSSDSTQNILVDGRFLPASECGGDWWGVYRRNGYTYVMLGDAVGHGMPAALVTAVAFSVSQKFDRELSIADAGTISPTAFIGAINDVLWAMNSKLACMTFLMFRIEDLTGQAVFANAGNLQPIIIPRQSDDERLAKGQRTKTLLARGDLLGLQRESIVLEQITYLKPGDKIVLYTDGLVENLGKKSQAPLGKKWLKDLMATHADAPVTSFSDIIWRTYTREVAATKVGDDVTLVVIERT
jgi:serine phosphatase RsbU (regulator of sigma subunit)